MSITATVPLVILAISALLLLLGAIADDRRARVKRFAMERVELPLIHSINDDRCIGCEACIDVCPTEVLELVDHKARVVRFSDCVQCEQCANSCPTTALVMHREGTAPQTLTVPELDENFQTGVPGQYLIGEVAGKPLVKNAANLGRAVIEHIARDLAKAGSRGADVLDVAIVGSGPGGLSAGLTCQVKKLTCVVLEKEHVLASTVSRYPKGKLFMAEPVDSGNLSYLPVFDATKEDLVGTWQKVVAGTKLPLKLGEAVETVKRGDDGIFTVKTTVATYRARMVVLATGLRGKPRLLAVPGANLEKVQSRLEDPDVFGGQHVLVVGGGDSAVEAAMSLVDAGATVTLSYRGDGFKRCKQGNQKRLAEMTAANKLPVLLESNVTEFTASAVSIKLKDGTISTIPNHQAFVLIGADTPVAWLEGSGVKFIEREHLYALGSTQDVVRRFAPDASECAKTPEQAIAIVHGKPVARPSRPATRNEQSIVRRIKNEFEEMVTELTGVFKIVEVDKSRVSKHVIGRRATTSSTLIPPEHLTRKTPVPKLFARHDPDSPYTPAGTTVEMMSLPALLKARAQKTGRTPPALPVTPAQAPLKQPRSREQPIYRTGMIETGPVPPVETTVETVALPRTIVDSTLAEITNVEDSVPPKPGTFEPESTTVVTPRKTAAPKQPGGGAYGPLRPKTNLGVECYPVVKTDRLPPIPPPPPPPVRPRAKGSEPPPVPRKRGSSP